MLQYWPWIVIGVSILVLILLRILGKRREEVSVTQQPYLEEIESIRRPVAAWSKDLAAAMPAIVTIAVLGSAIFVILSGSYAEAEQKWAFGSVGTVIGYWLKA